MNGARLAGNVDEIPHRPGEWQLRHYRDGDAQETHFVFGCPKGNGTCRVPLAPGRPNGWEWDGDTERPTLRPSIHCLSSRGGGCGWHGHVTAGVME